MRLTTVILIASLMQLSAATFGQRITLTQTNTPLKDVLKEIRKQSGFDIFYENKLISSNQKVSVAVTNATVEEVLSSALKGLNLKYEIEGKTISIRKQQETSAPLNKASFLTDKITVRGKVLDEKGEPLAGASVFVEGDKQILGSTNLRGEFILLNVEANATIIIAYMGYEPLNLTAKTDMGTVRMTLSTSNLSEVQITYNTGYQQISKERSTGSFSKPNLKVMLDRSAGSPTLLNRLEGLVPGLSSGSGGNGGIVIRGTTSINLNTEPLYVVDGIQVSREIFDNLNAQSVEDITILKDATASSIWGAKAANGVIVVVTKKGKGGDKLKIDYDGYYEFSGRPDRYYIPRISNAEHIALARELFPLFSASTSYSALQNIGLIPPHLQILYDANRNVITQAQANFKLDSLSQLSNLDQINDLLIRDASILNQTLSVSGGGKVHSFYGLAQHVGRVSNTPGQNDNAYQLLLNNQFTVSKRIKINLNAEINNRITNSKNVSIPGNIADNEYQLLKDSNGNPLNVNWAGAFVEARRLDFQARSRINLDYNPILEQDRAKSNTNLLNTRFQAGGTIDILEGLRFTGTYGYNYATNVGRSVRDERNYDVRVLKTRFTVAPTLTSVPVYNLPQFGGTLATTNSLTKSWTIRNQLTYDRDWDKHQLTAMFAQEARSEQGINSNGYFYGWDEDAQTSNFVDAVRLSSGTIAGVAGSVSGQTLLTLSPDIKEQPIVRTTSYVASAAYTFARKYSLNGSFRIDQGNLFGFDKSAQNKPVYSVGAKWSLGNEAFMKPVNWLNRLDLRLTYGITGNVPLPGQAASFDIFAAQVNLNAVNGSGLVLRTPANDKLTWELTKNYNAGLDFAMLNNRLSATVDVYLKKTNDLIGIVLTSPLTGYASVTGNFGAMQNKGIDIGLNSVNLRARNFTWSSSLMLGYNKNKLTKLNLNNVATTGAGLVGSSFSQGTTSIVGQSLYSLYAYNYAGLNASGDPQIRLADGTVTSAPNVSLPADILRMGVTQAPLSGGFGNNFQYKAFNLGINMIFNAGHVIRDPRVNTATDAVIYGNNFQRGFLERWKVPGDEARTDIPRYVANSTIAASRDLNYYNLGSARILSADYLKIRDISLSYSLPQLVANKINAQSITFRVNVNNLLLWTANDLDFDPEVNRNNSQITNVRPAQGTISLGAHITF
ncbi:SusC/RagA family TonB-linked outer membrane protein [Pedobacter africanus]|nr:SusC/RagA family TonB-linked outer membrane protein [Pedobacter africanus]